MTLLISGGRAPLPLFAAFLLSFLVTQNGGFANCQQTEILLEESSGVAAFSGPAGGLVRLPCDVSPTEPHDHLSLVIWYKQGHETPVYSFDNRNEVTHWSDYGTLGGRAKFDSEAQPAVLILDKLRAEDSGQYRCRVDFIKSPTKNSRLNLTVLLPPEKLLILTAGGEEVRSLTVGPYDEGTDVNLTCVAVGGRPTARVSWWKSHSLLGNSESRSTITLRLSREDLGTEVTCQAVTDPSMSPASITLKIDVNLKPLWVKMQGTRRPLVAGQLTEIVCQVVGARPKPSISWWKGGTRLRGARESVSGDGNMTTSILRLVPDVDDSGRVLSCRAVQAVQSATPDAGKEDGFKMEIQHVPVVKLDLGSNLDAGNVVEGSDVYLDCRIRANPWIYHVYFTHNNVPIKPSPGAGVHVSNQSLVLQGVSRAAAGTYLCRAANSLGEGRSNQLVLDVKYKPRCRKSEVTNVAEPHTTAIRAARGETINIACPVHANPQIITYRWWFNNTSHNKEEIRSEFFSDNSLIRGEQKNTGSLSYKINSSTSYGWIQCAGTNEAGEQRDACLFHILPAGKPSSVEDCVVENVTSSSLEISCSAGHDGGLEQDFELQIYDMSSGALLSNMSNVVPSFYVSGLGHDTRLRAVMRARNREGSSGAATVHVRTHDQPQRRTSQWSLSIQLTPLMLYAMAGSAVLIAAALMALLLTCRSRAAREYDHDRSDEGRNCGGEKKLSQDESSNVPLTKNNDSVDSLEKNPDLIPKRKLNDKTSYKSSSIDYNSMQPLISHNNMTDKFYNDTSSSYSFARFNFESVPLYSNPNDSINQYIQVRPSDYRGSPQSHDNFEFVNISGSGQNASVFGQHVGAYGKNEEDMVRLDGQACEDWLKFRNTPTFKTGPLPTPYPDSYRNDPYPRPLHVPTIHRQRPNIETDLEDSDDMVRRGWSPTSAAVRLCATGDGSSSVMFYNRSPPPVTAVPTKWPLLTQGLQVSPRTSAVPNTWSRPAADDLQNNVPTSAVQQSRT